DVTLADAVLPDLVGGDVDVLVAGLVAGDPEEAVALGEDVQQALADLQLVLGDHLLVATAAVAATSVALAALMALLLLIGSLILFGRPVVVGGRRLGTLGPRSGLGQLEIGLGGRLVGDAAGLHQRGDQLRLLESISFDSDGLGDLPEFFDRLAL